MRVANPACYQENGYTWVPDHQASGRVVEETAPSSYAIQTQDGTSSGDIICRLISTPVGEAQNSAEGMISTPQDENSESHANSQTGIQGP